MGGYADARKKLPGGSELIPSRKAATAGRPWASEGVIPGLSRYWPANVGPASVPPLDGSLSGRVDHSKRRLRLTSAKGGCGWQGM
jgi:hypothetical protein